MSTTVNKSKQMSIKVNNSQQKSHTKKKKSTEVNKS